MRVYNNGEHIKLSEALPEDIHLKWRLALLQVMDPIVKPNQKIPIREKAPVSHKLEPHRVVD
ncbi:hypothetical protein FRUB_05558 [Fimbriiglobus ruber]|uniref:Uncharacterized protein n=1 Tax=Fimbriiglobus ruber TaxID=1908690 RepID=A0A225DM99_9BACT|nr:hypothetical protein FRUB_05558 [Fimbriiglobus ruber]